MEKTKNGITFTLRMDHEQSELVKSAAGLLKISQNDYLNMSAMFLAKALDKFNQLSVDELRHFLFQNLK